jgi:hypothetical protein
MKALSPTALKNYSDEFLQEMLTAQLNILLFGGHRHINLENEPSLSWAFDFDDENWREDEFFKKVLDDFRSQGWDVNVPAEYLNFYAELD